MELGGEEIGRITFVLRADVAPKTAENFVSLPLPENVLSRQYSLLYIMVSFLHWECTSIVFLARFVHW